MVIEAEVVQPCRLPDGWNICVIRRGQMKLKVQSFFYILHLQEGLKPCVLVVKGVFKYYIIRLGEG